MGNWGHNFTRACYKKERVSFNIGLFIYNILVWPDEIIVHWIGQLIAQQKQINTQISTPAKLHKNHQNNKAVQVKLIIFYRKHYLKCLKRTSELSVNFPWNYNVSRVTRTRRNWTEPSLQLDNTHTHTHTHTVWYSTSRRITQFHYL